MAGDPANTDPSFIPGGTPIDGTNTYYGVPSLCTVTNEATGLETRDLFWVEDTTAAGTGCFFFGGYSDFNGCGGLQANSYASFTLSLIHI